MTAIDTVVERVRIPAATSHRTHKFRLLLRREFWENRNGFFWAPLVAGGIFLLLSMMGLALGEMAVGRATGTPELINGLDLRALTMDMSPSDLRDLGIAVDLSLFMASSWPLIVLSFVVFFYCLGALYDERKDRSVLFWKSLPLSDTETVLSKAASALLVAPTIATVIGIVTMFDFLVVASLIVLAHDGNPLYLLWGPGRPFAVAGNLAASIPVAAFWALPTVGWLMLCSAWAKSKPFLWAIMIPVFAGIFVTWFDLMRNFDLKSGWFWEHVVARMLLSATPGSWLAATDWSIEALDAAGPEALLKMASVADGYMLFATPQMWIGIVAGGAMIYAAIRLRRWRDEG